MSSDSNPTGLAIAVRNVGKCYHIYDRPQDRLKQSLWRGWRKFYNEFWALRDISFEIPAGGATGIIGRNGSGKSTLLQIIAGTLNPTEGEVEVNGRVAALLELGSGFNPDFTGRENVYMNGAILGLSQKEMDERFDAIASFADIGAFIDQPIKTYSSGMLVRLAFAVQVQVQPDILIVDEALAVGDSLFQKRCFQRMNELRSQGVTLLFVSHDQESVRTLTSEAVLLTEGKVTSSGSSASVILDYRRQLHEAEKGYFDSEIKRLNQAGAAPPPPQGKTASAALSFGDYDAEIAGVEVFDENGDPCTVFYPGQRMTIRVHAVTHRSLNHLNIAVRIRNKQGVKVYSWGTLNQDIMIWSGRHTGEVLWDRHHPANSRLSVDFECDCPLGTNVYEVQASISEENDRFYNDQRMLHWQDEAAFFQVAMNQREYFFGGAFDLRMQAHVRT